MVDNDIEQLNRALRDAETEDYMKGSKGSNKKLITINSPDGRKALLTFGGDHSRRNADPLDLKSKCFCDFRLEKDSKWVHISDDSDLFFLTDRVHQCARDCGPEPRREHYADMVEVIEHIHVPSICLVNLASSGASIPQHFHTQIFPLRLRDEKSNESAPNSLDQVWNNLRVADGALLESAISITEVLSPIWGVRLKFDKQIASRERGKKLFEIIHQSIRYRSQLCLTYNLYIHSETRNEVTILFREPRYENVFLLDEIHMLIEQIAGHVEARRIAASKNQLWRWAWLECLGGFPARDDSFADEKTFGWEFWSRIWKRISLRSELRRTVLERIIAAVKDNQPMSNA